MPTVAAFSAVWARHLLEEFDGQGWHRTGSEGDEAATRWFVQQFAQLGIASEVFRWEFPLVRTERAEIAVGELVVPGHGQPDAGSTGETGVTAPLALAERATPGCIAVFEIGSAPAAKPGGVSQDERIGAFGALASVPERTRQMGAVGAVVIAHTGGSEYRQNAVNILHPDTLPLLYVPPAAGGAVLAAAARGETANLTVVLRRQTATTTNVQARIPATVQAGPPLGIVTPKSGWFHCAGERGGGIVALLAAAAALADHRNRRRDVLLTANSGHELGHHLGMETYLQANPRVATEAMAWIHLGANIGATPEAVCTVRTSDDDLRSTVAGALERAGAGPFRLDPAGSAAIGEGALVQQRGGRYISMAGFAYPYFHTPEDRLDKLSYDNIAGFANAVADLAVTLTGRE